MNAAVAPLLIPIFAIVFSLSIPIVAIIVDYLKRKNKMKVIEKAIEKGVLLEGLSLEEMKGPRVPYRSGMITLAVGLGICIFALFIGKTVGVNTGSAAEALYPLLGIGAIPTLVGIALIINDKINYDRYFKQDSDLPSS